VEIHHPPFLEDQLNEINSIKLRNLNRLYFKGYSK